MLLVCVLAGMGHELLPYRSTVAASAQNSGVHFSGEQKQCRLVQLQAGIDYLSHYNRPNRDQHRAACAALIHDKDAPLQLDRVDWEYIGGLFDAEGCVTIGTRGSVQIQITQVDRPALLEKIQKLMEEFLEDKWRCVQPKAPRLQVKQIGKVYHDRWALCAGNQIMVWAVNALLPYIRFEDKKQQLQHALRWLEHKDAESRIRVRELKHVDKDVDK